MKTRVLLSLLLCMAPLAAQEPRRTPPPTALEALTAFKVHSGRESVTSIVEMRGKGGTPTPELWHLVILDPRSSTKLAEYSIRGPRVEHRGANKDYYPDVEPSGFFDLPKVNVDCAGAFRIADREAGKAMVGFDTIDYKLRAREYSDEPVWTLTLRAKTGAVTGTVAISAVGGKVLRTVWTRTGPDGRAVLDDSAMPAQFRPPAPQPPPAPAPAPPPPPVPSAPVPPPRPMPDPFPDRPAVPDPNAPAPPPLPPDPEDGERLPPPPPLPPLGQPPPVPNITPD